MDRRILVIIGALLLLCAFLPLVRASPEAVFEWDEETVEEGKTAYINFYQNFKYDYNFTIISDLVEECWVVKDYYDENRVVCRSENGLCRSIQPLDYQYIRCKTWNIYGLDGGQKATLFYEYEDEWGRKQGIYQTQELFVPGWAEKVTGAGPLMIALIASLIVLVIVLAIIYFAGSTLASWLGKLGESETESYQELKNVKNQIGSRAEVFSNCIVIY